ncbi:HNH endonuclease [Synechococcus sp. CS-1326]|uniref:HNH endonuclease n=1 Tax=Synechococcus sp. CS-1326 TaxID=2847978 RepID=UPI00223BBD8F|nr:HNH endonuclease [Synechococcus sp. CS-1326]
MQQYGFGAAEFTKLHHFSLKGRTEQLSKAIWHFQRTKSIQGNNLSLAKRCEYVATQLKAGRADKDIIIAEALEQWPLIDDRSPNRKELAQADVGPSQELVKTIEFDLRAAEEEVEGWEGERTVRLVAHYERKAHLRAAALHYHGTSCKACGFDFSLTYGAHGADFIEVHHLVPVSSLGESRAVNPLTDMTVLCANCHRMIHRRRDAQLSLESLRKLLDNQSKMYSSGA